MNNNFQKSYEISIEEIREAVKTKLMEIAENLTVEAGYAASFRAQVYSALVHHCRKKFLKGTSLGLAEIEDVNYLWKMLSQIENRIKAIPGLIAGVIEYGDK